MPKALDLTDQRFGRLVARSVVSLQASSGKRYRYWECLCDCGKLAQVKAAKLRSGHTRSCGCLDTEAFAQRIEQYRPGPTHGQSLSVEYRIWIGMRRRCDDPNADAYVYYGARGIAVCERWHNFANFLADMGPRPSPQYSIDRIDNDGHYEPGNCRWATRSQQVQNRRRK